MSTFVRRNLLKMFGAGAALAAVQSPVLRALAEGEGQSDELFVVIHAQGAWDVTLWSDPRNKPDKGLDVASTGNTDTSGLTLWQDTALGDGESTFKLVKPAGSNLVFGPGIGEMASLFDRMCVVNGIAMNTVAHPDGTVFSATGRHLSGGRASQPSVDAMLADALGVEQTLPLVSVGFPSWHHNDLDPRSVPVRVDSVAGVAESLTRVQKFESVAQRQLVTAMLTEEAKDLADASLRPEVYAAFGTQYQALSAMLTPKVKNIFNADKLLTAQPQFTAAGKPKMAFFTDDVINAAFAVEAMKANLVRCVSFGVGSFDTHNTNYEDHAHKLQDLFAILARMIEGLDAAPHPTLAGQKLADHTHILVISDFCRSPGINVTNGRDHHPNNSALLVSPKIKGNTSIGTTDPAQVLPESLTGVFAKDRPIEPPDVLATLLTAVGVEPRDYLREGEVITPILKEGA
jgi:uncharacterized protein (DUF1501 family)